MRSHHKAASKSGDAIREVSSSRFLPVGTGLPLTELRLIVYYSGGPLLDDAEPSTAATAPCFPTAFCAGDVAAQPVLKDRLMPLPQAVSWPSTMVLSMTLLLGGGSASLAGPADAQGAGTASGTDPWSWPVGGPEALLDPFAAPPAPWAAGHRGVDLRAGAGTGVNSPADGVILFSGVVADRQVLTIDHGAGLVSSFEPVVAQLEVGARVASGQQVARVGAGGHCSGVCLHWGVRLNGDYIDPLSLLMDRRPSILLPVPEGASRRGLDRRPRA